MLPDCRELLREGDALVKAGKHAAAVHLYADAARTFAQSGQALKAIAVFRQVRDLIARLELTERALEAEARVRLAELYRTLGLFEEADAVEREP